MHKFRSDILSGQPQRPAVVATKSSKPASLSGSLAAVAVKRTESRRTNQRESERIPGVLAQTTLTIRRRKLQARVVNLSSDGAMLEVDADARIGDRVTITLGDESTGKATVRWVRDRRIGLEFEGFNLEIGRTKDGGFAFRRHDGARRKTSERAPRQSLVWRANIHAGHESVAVKLANVSATGALVQGPLDLSPDTSVLLDFPSVGMMPSTVRWCKDGQMGLSFDRHFDVSLLSICSLSAEAIRKIDWVKPEYLQDERDPNSPHAAAWDKFTVADL